MKGSNLAVWRVGPHPEGTAQTHAGFATGACVGLLLLLLVFTAAAARAEAAGQEPSGGPTTTIRLDDLLGRVPTTGEETKIRAVLEALRSSNGAAETVCSGRAVRLELLSWRDAAVRALRTNLLILAERDAADMAREALMEAEAVFDPVLSFSLSRAEADAYDRSQRMPLQTKRFVPGLPLQIPTAPDKEEAQIVELGWNYQAEGNREIQEIFASQEPENGPPRTARGSVEIAQVLPWGAELHLSTATLHQETFYDTEGHSYDAPFASSLTLELQSPLPGTRGFGPHARRDTAVRLAENRKAWQYWSVQAVVNTVLSQVHEAYWGLVAAVESLSVAEERRAVMEEQRTLWQRRFDNRLATAYDLRQIQAEYAASRLQEASVLHGLLSRARALAVLIEDDPKVLEDTLFLPYQYTALLAEAGGVAPNDALETARRCRPELRMAEIDLERTRISKAFSRQQLRPDLRAFASLSLVEDGSIHGYKTLQASVKNLSHPDQESKHVQLDYAYPVGNQALKARHDRSVITEKNIELSYAFIENRVEREVRDAVGLMRTSKQRVAMAQRNVDRIHAAYRIIQERQTLGEARPFEWILNLQRLMEARISLVLARVDHRLARCRLAAAQGTLETETVNRLAANPGDRLRIQGLAAGNQLVFFNPERVGRGAPVPQSPGPGSTNTSGRRRP